MQQLLFLNACNHYKFITDIQNMPYFSQGYVNTNSKHLKRLLPELSLNSVSVKQCDNVKTLYTDDLEPNEDTIKHA